jgi:integrase
LVASEYLQERRSKVAPTTYREEELRLNRICDLLHVNLCDLQKSQLEAFFGQELQHNKGKTRNHYRQTFRQLFKFAVRRDYLPEKHRLNEVLVNESSDEAAPQILSPKQFKRLLSAASPEMLPYIAISGLTGARRSEVLRLTWEDVWRVEGYIEMEAAKTKTKQRRLVPLCRSLSEWLTPYRNNKGAVWKSSNGSFHAQIQRLMLGCGIKGQNLLRHSYASYRLAEIQDPTKVAVEMGNSPEKLYRNYNKLRTPKEAKEWFSSEHGLVTVG